MYVTPSSHLTLGLGIPFAIQLMFADEPYSSSISERLGAMNMGGIKRSNQINRINHYLKKYYY